MDYKDKIRKLLALAKSPEPEEANCVSCPNTLVVVPEVVMPTTELTYLL